LPPELVKIVEKKTALFKDIDDAFTKFHDLQIVLKKKPAAADWKPADTAKILDYYLLFSTYADGPKICFSIHDHLVAIQKQKISAFLKVLDKDNTTKSAVKECLRVYKAEYVDPSSEN
jgi:hypothetical protein